MTILSRENFARPKKTRNQYPGTRWSNIAEIGLKLKRKQKSSVKRFQYTVTGTIAKKRINESIKEDIRSCDL